MANPLFRPHPRGFVRAHAQAVKTYLGRLVDADGHLRTRSGGYYGYFADSDFVWIAQTQVSFTAFLDTLKPTGVCDPIFPVLPPMLIADELRQLQAATSRDEQIGILNRMLNRAKKKSAPQIAGPTADMHLEVLDQAGGPGGNRTVGPPASSNLPKAPSARLVVPVARPVEHMRDRADDVDDEGES